MLLAVCFPQWEEAYVNLHTYIMLLHPITFYLNGILFFPMYSGFSAFYTFTK